MFETTYLLTQTFLLLLTSIKIHSYSCNIITKKVQIINPYFTPTKIITKAIKKAIQNGVKVEIMIPGKSDIKFTPDAALYIANQLRKEGADIYIFNGGFHHSKVMAIDGNCCMIGSANLESRSLFYDHEQNAIVVDSTLVNDFVEIYERDKLDSDTLTRKLYKKTSPWKRFVGHLAVFLRPVL